MKGGRIMQAIILALISNIKDEHMMEVIYEFITALIIDE